jgi:hypothetical protein
MMTVKFTNDDDQEIEVTFPSIMVVCHECQGEGSVLCEGMRGHAYSAEEFHESFDQDEAREYFTRGGIYDQTCPCCHGQNVVPEVNEKLLTATQKIQYEEYCQYQETCARYDAEDRATMRAECGYRE